METVKNTTSFNPATGEIIGQTKENTIDELQQSINEARVAQKEWAKKTFNERKEHLLRIRNFIVENADELAEIISKDTGKTRMDALSTEVFPITMAISYYAKTAKHHLKRKRIRTGNILLINKRSYVDRAPLGVIGIISPWNYPFAIPFHEIAMALIAGNAVILKVATQTLEVGKAINKCVDAAQLPEGLFHLLNIPGNIAGDAFIDSGINKIFFTGSVVVGKKLMKKASEKLVPLSLELGGNDAMIVCNDADIVRAAGGALWAGLSNSGQSCAGVERIYVEENVYERFVSLLKEKLNKLRQGIDTDHEVEIGSLTTTNQLETVRKHFADAVEKGAVPYIKQQQEKANGLFYPLVILENVNDQMLTMNEETFGPILCIKKVKNTDEAIIEANKSSLGLTASVWTTDRSKAHKIASQLETGAVTINDHLMSHGLAETPWGGWKESGLGRTHSYIGLEEMTQPRVVVDDIMPFVKKNMWWYPHNKKVYNGLKGGMEFLYSTNLSRRFNGFVNLLKVFLRSFTE